MQASTGSAFVIRRAETTDIPGIHRLLSETWHASYDAIMGADEVENRVKALFSPARLDAMINATDRNHWFGIAHAGGTVAGVSTAGFSISGRLSIGMIYIHPRFQREGLGTHFLYVIAAAFPCARTVFVEVLEANTDAIRFYKRNGFAPLGVIADGRRANVPIMGMLQTVPNGPSRMECARIYLSGSLGSVRR